jgi:uncharacterized membrane protein
MHLIILFEGLMDIASGRVGWMRALIALAVTLGAVFVVLHLIHNPTMENFLTGLWQQIHLTRQ